MKITGQVAMFALGTTVLCSPYTAKATDRIKDNFSFTYHIEVAGADGTNVATDKELRESGTNMVPAQPSAQSRDPLQKPAPLEIKKAEPQTVPDPVPSPENEPANSAAKAEAPAAAAQETTPAAATEPPASSTSAAESADKNPELLFKPYLRIDGGFAITSNPEGTGTNGQHLSNEVQDTGLISIGLGTRVDDQIRAEGMFTYRSPMDLNGIDGAGNTLSSEVESMSAMLNLYYDVEQAHQWLGTDVVTPYVGAGVGISMLDTDSMTSTAGTTERGTTVYNLTYAAMAGLASKISESMTLDVGYRFMNLGPYEQDGSFSTGGSTTATKYDDLYAHEFRAGIRFQF